uniref:Uncharacterized protein n=1 Tax=Eutreptiella gymnastica TaxID=73025 RepID=A0A7S4FHC3_9EUGL|mmetsp:Transcript_60945/g.100865  ORF Transcript_60945/g.100865 Transcript_60945/m.100865 type:complete len:145 (-) Transcript_60945:229-663(-)
MRTRPRPEDCAGSASGAYQWCPRAHSLPHQMQWASQTCLGWFTADHHRHATWCPLSPELRGLGQAAPSSTTGATAAAHPPTQYGVGEDRTSSMYSWHSSKQTRQWLSGATGGCQSEIAHVQVVTGDDGVPQANDWDNLQPDKRT